MGAEPPTALCDVRLTLSARADQLLLVRQVMSLLATSLGFADQLADDVRLAVTEACTNVVRHAYADATGALEVTASAAGTGLTVSVTDHGRGLRERAPRSDGGLGLPLMAALATGFAIEDASGGGTTVRLSFAAAE